jgi:hypothetical protein
VSHDTHSHFTLDLTNNLFQTNHTKTLEEYLAKGGRKDGILAKLVERI